MASTLEPRDALLFKEWLVSRGGSFHPSVRYSSAGTSGLSILASEAIGPDATIVSCPFSIIITPHLCKGALLPILHDASALERWTERQSIIVYICFHWIASPETYDTLIHTPYLNTLPPPDQLRTTLHFTSEELDALRGTNLYGATVVRRQVWEAEWEQCRADVSVVNAEWGKELSWERFLTASTYLSSRAFPSTLLSSSPSLIQRPDSFPVLIPGIDALNHARAQPVSWVVTSSPASAQHRDTSASASSISLVTHSASKPGTEIFNNYGAKPNSELLLGYGFTLPANPDDTIVLKIGGTRDTNATAAAAAAGVGYEVGRGARGATAVWDAIVDAVKTAEEGGGEEKEEAPEWQITLDSADMLRSMTESLLGRLPRPVPPEPEVPGPEAAGGLRRGGVVEMIRHYVSGQRDVLQDLLQFADDREMGGVALARHEGIVIELQGGED